MSSWSEAAGSRRGVPLFLVVAGASVVSKEAGLSVPDWPLSYGKVMPEMKDGVFFEHGHRMVATTVGFGPRFLHSTGQFHKGGPATGLFLQLTAEDVRDIPIPGAPYTFGVFKRAQALGDLSSRSAARPRTSSAVRTRRSGDRRPSGRHPG